MLLDVRDLVAFADYFVISTATNPRHLRAVVETLERELRGDGVRIRHREGSEDSGWVLMDYDSVIVHVFSPELRQHYALEELWQSARQVVRIQ